MQNQYESLGGAKEEEEEEFESKPGTLAGFLRRVNPFAARPIDRIRKLHSSSASSSSGATNTNHWMKDENSKGIFHR